MFERFFKEGGFDSFAEHESLEMLLYFTIAQGDTNGTGHELIERYSNLKGVLEADYEDLLTVKGIGDKSAKLIKISQALAVKYIQSGFDKKNIIQNVHDACEYVSSLFFACEYEQFYVICLDTQGRVIRACKINEGEISQTSVNLRKVIEAVLRFKSFSVILAHNHPTDNLTPSEDDMATTIDIINALASLNIKVVDHVIACHSKTLSFSQNGLLDLLTQKPFNNEARKLIANNEIMKYDSM